MDDITLKVLIWTLCGLVTGIGTHFILGKEYDAGWEACAAGFLMWPAFIIVFIYIALFHGLGRARKD